MGIKIEMDLVGKARLAAACFWAGAVALMVGSHFMSEPDFDSWWYLALNMAVIVLPLVYWVAFDAQSRNVKDRAVYAAGVFVFAPVLVPFYVVKTRGWSGAGKWGFRVAGYLACAMLVYFIAVTALAYFGAFDAQPTVPADGPASRARG